MPEKRLARARGTLPAGFQFGDGAIETVEVVRVTVFDEFMVSLCRCGRELRGRQAIRDHSCRFTAFKLPPSWRAAHVNAAERLGWNTIEAED